MKKIHKKISENWSFREFRKKIFQNGADMRFIKFLKKLFVRIKLLL